MPTVYSNIGFVINWTGNTLYIFDSFETQTKRYNELTHLESVYIWYIVYCVVCLLDRLLFTHNSNCFIFLKCLLIFKMPEKATRPHWRLSPWLIYDNSWIWCSYSDVLYCFVCWVWSCSLVFIEKSRHSGARNVPKVGLKTIDISHCFLCFSFRGQFHCD